MRRRLPLAATTAALLLVPLMTPSARGDDAIDLGTRRELFVDQHLIDHVDGAELRLVPPRDEGSVLRFDNPWEGLFCGYVTVLHDGDKFRLYYRGMPKAGGDGKADEVACYAESSDGRNWTKPNLGLFEVAGTRENNASSSTMN